MANSTTTSPNLFSTLKPLAVKAFSLKSGESFKAAFIALVSTTGFGRYSPLPEDGQENPTSKMSRAALLLTLKGEKKVVTEEDVSGACACRIPKEQREALVNAAGRALESLRFEQAIRAAERAKNTATQKESAAVSILKQLVDECSLNDFASTLEEELRTAREHTHFFCRTRQSDPELLVYGKKVDGKIIVTVTLNTSIEKYCRRSNYPFVYEEYDGSLFVDNKAARKEAMEREVDASCFGFSFPKGTKKIEPHFYIGDKDTLGFSQGWEFPVKEKDLKKSVARDLASSITKDA